MRALITRAALPALALGLLLIGLRLITWPLWNGIDPVLRTLFIAIVLGLLGLSLLGAALAPDGMRHRNLAAWLSVSAAIAGFAILDRDYTDLQYQAVWGAAPADGAGGRRSGNGVELSGGAIVLERRFDGHFYLDTEINGASVTFLVDTGATGVALSLADARRVGIRTDQLDYNVMTSTAAGPSMAAAVQISELGLPGRSFRNVPALVMRGGQQSLLGMSVLERFESVEIRRDQLILRP